MYTALILNGRFDLYDEYDVRSVENAGDVNPTQMTDMLVVPEGMSVTEYLTQRFEGRWTGQRCSGAPDFHSVKVWKHRYIAQDLSLSELLLQINAFGAVLVAELDSVWSDLEDGGFGRRQTGKRLNAFCNGLVLERVPLPQQLYIATTDARRAKRVLAAQARSTAGCRKPVKRPARLRMNTIANYGFCLKTYVWARMALNEIRRCCIAGQAYVTFKSNGWRQTLYSVQCMHQFYKKNKIALVGPAKLFWKTYPQPVYRDTPQLIERHIKGLQARKQADAEYLAHTVSILRRIRKLLLQTMPKEKKCAPSK